MAIDFETDDLTLVLNESRKLAISFQHGLIDYSHLFVAMLTTDCMAKVFCKHCNVDSWTSWLKNKYPATGTETMEDSLPLTIFAERTIMNGRSITHKCDEDGLNSVHLLLSILTPASEVSTSFLEADITFEDILTGYGKPPFEKFLPAFRWFRKGPYSRWELFFLSADSRKDKVTKLHELAYEAWIYGLYDRCITACQVGLSLDPNYKKLSTLQMNCYSKKRDFPACIQHLTPLIAAEPDAKDLRITLAHCYSEIGEYNKAAGILDELLAVTPENDAAYSTLLNNKGFNLSLQGRYKESIPFFEKACVLDPAFAYPWDNKGFAQYKLGSVEEGLSSIDKSLQLDKGNSYAYKYKGILFFEQGNKEEALRNFRLALKYNYTELYGNEVEEWMKKMG